MKKFLATLFLLFLSLDAHARIGFVPENYFHPISSTSITTNENIESLRTPQVLVDDGTFGTSSFGFKSCPGCGMRLANGGDRLQLDIDGTFAGSFGYVNGQGSVWSFNSDGLRLHSSNGTEYLVVSGNEWRWSSNVSLFWLSNDFQVDGDINTYGSNVFDGEQTFIVGNFNISSIPAPGNPPTAGLSFPVTPGSVSNGDHTYRTVYHAANDQTTFGGPPSTAVTVVDNSVNGVVHLSNLTASPHSSIAYVDIYRDKDSDGNYLFVGSVINGVDTYDDTIADGGLGQIIPPINRTGGAVIDASLSIINAGIDIDENGLSISTPLKPEGLFLEHKGNDVASANDLTLGTDGSSWTITGATQINRIAQGSFRPGISIKLIFASTPVVKNGQASGSGYKKILCDGGDYSPTAGSVADLYYDGTNFYLHPFYAAP